MIKEQAKIPLIPGNPEANEAHAKHENKLEGEDEKLKKLRSENNDLEKQRQQQQQEINLLRTRVCKHFFFNFSQNICFGKFFQTIFY